MRLDQWLWAVRVFKTRSLAAEAIRTGQVHLGDQPTKAAHEVRVGEVIIVQRGPAQRTFHVEGIPVHRVGAKRVPEFMKELTSDEERQKMRNDRVLRPLFPSLRGVFTPEPRADA